MSESKGASRRPSKGKTIDLEAQEMTPPQDAADAPPAEASPDAVSDTDSAQAAAPEQPGEPVYADTDAPVRDELADAREESTAETAASSGTAERAQEAAPAVVQKRGAGPLGLLTAAILGGIVAAGGLVGLNASGVVGEIPGLGTAPQADPAALSSMESELAALRDKVAALESAPAAGASIDPARIDSLESRIAAVETEAATLKDTVAAVQQSPGAAGEPAQDNAMAARLDALEARVSEAQAGSGGTDSAVIAQLSGKVDAGLESVNAAVARNSDKVADVESRVNSLEQSVSQISSDIEAGAASGKEAARMIAADTLRNAAQEGRPFDDLIGPVEALTGPSPELDTLKAQATSGLARPATLLAEFGPAADAILALDAPKPEGMLEGLLANARSLVKVQPAGPLEGSSNEAIVSRIRAALEAGNLSDALAQWQSLSEPARNASAQWGQKLKTRVEAGAALDGVLADLAQG